MMHFKHYCKLIFSTLVVVLVFACLSFSASAQIPFMPDPISGAMAGSMAASGFAVSGVSGLSASDVSPLFNSSSDPVPWDSISHKSAKVSSKDSNTYSVELSPSISTAGERRTEYVNQAYSLAPGSFHTIGSYYAYNGYAFTRSTNSTTFYGASIGSPQGIGVTLSLDPYVYITLSQTPSRPLYRDYSASIGSASSTGSKYVSDYDQVVFALSTSYNPPRFSFAMRHSSDAYNVGLSSFFNYLAPNDITLSTFSPVVSRSQDSEIVDPLGRKNVIDLPKSYLNQISFIEDTDITDDDTLKEILTQVFQAFIENAISSSTYSDDPTPPPPPVPGETVSETLWTDFTDFFTEAFGDIYDGITDFHESFGDWVDNVASGWTEVFGDISSDLHDFKESFGDWVEDIASGWTEVFGDIFSTLSSISSTISGTISDTLSAIETAVETLVDTIENADFQFIEGFWKNFITPFNTLFNTIKSHLSIWHYVVEWLSSISSVFTFYRGVMSGAGSGFLLPIYACFAGTVVLAVYKRFGK